MTREVNTCTAQDSVNNLMQVMTDKRIRHVPVLTDGKVTGIISIGDVVKSRMSELEFERDQLDSYVHTAQT
jgi:signal-transduction protein with cAMP-binding, CBS, and nucleotidyltransferase domain